MKKMRGKLLKAAALTAAAFTLSLPLSLQSNVMPITAHALYSPTDTNYTTGQSGGLQYAKYSRQKMYSLSLTSIYRIHRIEQQFLVLITYQNHLENFETRIT